MSDEGETKELVFAPTKENLRFGEFRDACEKRASPQKADKRETCRPNGRWERHPCCTQSAFQTMTTEQFIQYTVHKGAAATRQAMMGPEVTVWSKRVTAWIGLGGAHGMAESSPDLA